METISSLIFVTVYMATPLGQKHWTEYVDTV
jgi:hypothetical protein